MAVARRAAMVTVNSGAANAATVVLTPDASWQSGDFIVGFLAYTNVSTLTLPTGWASSANNSSTALSGVLVSKLFTGSDVNPTTHTFTIATATRFIGFFMAFTGVDTTTPFHQSQSNNGATLAGPAMTTTITAYEVAAWMARNSAYTGAQTVSPPAGTHGTVGQVSTTQGGSTFQAALAVGELSGNPVASGTYGGYTATMSPGAVANAVGFQIALTPAAAAASAFPFQRRVHPSRNTLLRR